MREYRFQSTEETVAALRLLRGAWAGLRVEERAFTVRLRGVEGAAAREVRVEAEGADVEDALEAFRLRAVDGPALDDPVDEAPDFAVGRNDVVLFTGATWLEGAVQYGGHPGQLSETASIVCLTTDAIVVASPVGTGFLVRTGVKPGTLETTSDAGALARFLGERGYAG